MGAGAYLNRFRQPTDYQVFVFPLDIDPKLEQAYNALENAAKSARQSPAQLMKLPQEIDDQVQDASNIDTFGWYSLAKAMRDGVHQYTLLGLSGIAKIKRIGGQDYIIIKDISGNMPTLKGTKYAKISVTASCFVVGAEEIKEDAGAATRLAVYFYVPFEIYKYLASQKEPAVDQETLAALGVHIASDVGQAAVANILGAEAGVLFIAMVGATPVVITFVIGVAVGVAVGLALTYLDHKFHLTERAADFFSLLETDPSAACNEFWSSADDMMADFVTLPQTHYSLQEDTWHF